MIVAQIRIGGESEPPVSLHPALTVLSGLDPSARQELASELAGALRGEPANVAVEIEVDGKREWLGPDVVQRLGLQASTSVVVVQPGALPGATMPPPPAASPVDDAGAGAFREAAGAAEAAQAAASAAVAEAEAGLAAAATGAAAATEAVAAAAAAGDTGGDEAGAAKADEAVAAGRGRLEQARQDLAAARSALAEGEVAQAREQEQERAAAAEQARGAQLLERLVGQQGELEQARAELVARLVAIQPQDLAPVQQALLELQRLRAVKPVPSAAAIQLAERWVEARRRLAALPAPPEPPEWLVAPAMAALHEAREALARAEAGTADTAADARLVEALDRAHRQVLEAEQKMMRKGSRLHRRRLDQAYEAEQRALLALGVTSYGEYLQRIAPSAAGEPKTEEDPAAGARAALADAEAVWEELHGGLASPEWTAAKEEEDALRAQAHELLGRPVPDAQLAAALRGHHDAVVDVKRAEEALGRVIGAPEGEGSRGPDLEEGAERWLKEAEASNNARAELERQLAQLDERLEAVLNEVSEHQADAFFGRTDATAPAGEGDDENRRQRLSTATAQVQKAEQEELEAQAALAGLEQQAAFEHERRQRSAYLQGEAEAAQQAMRAAEASLNDARQAQEAAQTAALAAVEAAIAAEAAPPPAQAPAPVQPEPDLTGVTALEAEIYLLARLAAVQGAPQGPLPLFVDATTVARLSEPASRRALALLERAAGPVQVVFLGDDGPVGEWAKRKGAGAAVVAATRPPQQSRR